MSGSESGEVIFDGQLANALQIKINNVFDHLEPSKRNLQIIMQGNADLTTRILGFCSNLARYS